MARALALASRGLGATNPNPLVGAVLVRKGKVVGEGYHAKAGGPHAEIVALERAGKTARGATLYVNLEPCAHFGRTPPCAPRLVEAGIRRVVAATRDPNPAVSGRGFRILRRGGIAIETGVLREAAQLLNRPFFEAIRTRRPFVLLKAALTLDGRIATATGESTWITSSAQRRAARRLRGFFDGVAVGIGTVLADDPLLLPSPRRSRPFYRIVFDTHFKIPESSRLVKTARQGPVVVLCASFEPRKEARLRARGVRVLAVGVRRGRVSLPTGLEALRKLGILSLMVEGGSELLGSFLDERCFQEVALFRAPLLLGGGSLPAFGGEGARKLKNAAHLVPLALPARYPVFRRGLFELYSP